MSRIGRLPIVIPPKVKVEVKGQKVAVEGPKGKLSFDLPEHTSAVVEDGKVVVKRAGESAEMRALHGMSRAMVNNLVQGVTEGFAKRLEINGVGYKAAVQGKVLNLSLGYSHPVNFTVPEGIKITVEENTKINVEGSDKQLVGHVAAVIRGFCPPEPYKGKGIKYATEKIVRKEGKTVQQ